MSEIKCPAFIKDTLNDIIGQSFIKHICAEDGTEFKVVVYNFPHPHSIVTFGEAIDNNRYIAIDKLKSESSEGAGITKIKVFARWVINTQCFANDIDGASIQEKAEELGLIKLDNVTAEDVETHDYYTKEDIGDPSIYRFTGILEEK